MSETATMPIPLDNVVVNGDFLKKEGTSKISIPKPRTSEELEQLIFRYRAIITRPEENSLEINAIENVMAQISEEQDQFSSRLAEVKQLREQLSKYNNEKLERQLQALRLLERDFGIPENLLHNTDQTDDQGEIENHQLEKVKLTLDMDENAALLGLANKFKHLSKNNKLGNREYEEIISTRIAQRIYELERLPGNLATYSLDDCLDFISKDETPTKIDEMKIKAIIELKTLKMLTKQKALRLKLISTVAGQAHYNIPYLRDSPYTMAAQRSVQVRSKVIVPQTARIAEELERQQLLEKRKKERNLHMQKVNSTISFITERKENRWTSGERSSQFGRICLSLHGQIERDEQKRVERTAKQRLQALKSNDEEAYLRLLDQTKDTRITQLLKQTNSFLDSLAQAVRVQQNETKILKGEEITPIDDEEREKIDYYEVAHRIKEKIDKQPSILVGGTLKEYQLKGLEWMVSLYNNHLNGILADEMGLGKTIQSISLITYLYEIKQEPGPYLVVVPLSTITNWTLEFEKWAPSLNTVIYKGTPNQRHSLQHKIRSGNFDVLLTTYEYIIKDKALLSKHEWSHMIIDEGHRMKNANSKLSNTISHYYRTRNRLILTGTPLQNNLPELWALLNFVLPKIFNSAKTFEDWFNTPFANTGTQEKLELTEEETLLVIRRLHKVLRPFLLRRLKKEVEKDLPDKVEKVIKCRQSALQQQLYQQMLKHNALFVGAGTEGATKGGIKGLNNKIMQLKKICNHPFVFDEVEGVINPSRGNSDLLYRVAGKFELLDRILSKFKATGHRVLMFFQMTQVMDIMEDFLRMRNLKYMRLDGSTKAEDRTGMLKEFNAENSEYFCFLLSTRAGGLGLNLQTADTVIIFDTDWNPHQDLQAQDRAHRIGQKNEVRILRLITTDSVEEMILERAMQKLDIDGKVIQAGKFDNKSTAEEQEEFLRRLLENESNKDEDDKAELDDDELNDILARSADEKILFDKMDQERIEQEVQSAKEMGLSAPKPRLIEIDELPSVFTEDIEQHLKPEPVTLGRMRNTKRVFYDDGLTEEQFLDAVENDNSTLEEVIKRKREARERRTRNKQLKVEGASGEVDEEAEGVNGVIENDDNDYKEDAIPEETITERRGRRGRKRKAVQPDIVEAEAVIETHEVEAKSPKKRGRKRVIKIVDSSKAEPEDEITKENQDSGPLVEIIEGPDKKKPKLKIKLKLKKPSGEEEVKPETETAPEEEAPAIKKSIAKGRGRKPKAVTLEIIKPVETLLKQMRGQVDETDAHPLTSIFEVLPSKREYPDYYKLIEKPVALDNILKNAKRGVYKSLKDVQTDLQTMFDNARFYNEEGSWVYNDAEKLNKFTNTWFDENIK
ncbi:RSC chromatin remodeling complex ATPase subunit STH1 [Nakaseomyces bracarensis]|uniref:RSC chromatin remodeling complex ATPase subunit STH1 n=1 Tax=Nakaseomyces bracarensis TaxID=273131 RepID=UPI003871F851